MHYFAFLVYMIGNFLPLVEIDPILVFFYQGLNFQYLHKIVLPVIYFLSNRVFEKSTLVY